MKSYNNPVVSLLTVQKVKRSLILAIPSLYENIKVIFL